MSDIENIFRCAPIYVPPSSEELGPSYRDYCQFCASEPRYYQFFIDGHRDWPVCDSCALRLLGQELFALLTDEQWSWP